MFKLIIYKYLENWYIASGRDIYGKYLWGSGRTHLEAFEDATREIIL
jgi:hypothetical protein